MSNSNIFPLPHTPECLFLLWITSNTVKNWAFIFNMKDNNGDIKNIFPPQLLQGVDVVPP